MITLLATVAAVSFVSAVTAVTLYIRERRKVRSADEHGIMVLGACVGLGWDGRGTPARKMKREAERRIHKAWIRDTQKGKTE